MHPVVAMKHKLSNEYGRYKCSWLKFDSSLNSRDSKKMESHCNVGSNIRMTKGYDGTKALPLDIIIVPPTMANNIPIPLTEDMARLC